MSFGLPLLPIAFAPSRRAGRAARAARETGRGEPRDRRGPRVPPHRPALKDAPLLTLPLRIPTPRASSAGGVPVHPTPDGDGAAAQAVRLPARVRLHVRATEETAMSPERFTDAFLNEPVTKHARADFTTLEPEWTVGEALDHMRTNPPPGRIIYFYVVDEECRLRRRRPDPPAAAQPAGGAR